MVDKLINNPMAKANVEFCPKTGRLVPIAKHPGYSAYITTRFLQVVQQAADSMRKWYERRKSIAAVQGMLELDPAVLRDMSLTRADITYVLRSKSPLMPTDRLKVIALQRRRTERADEERRRDYFRAIVPPPFNGEPRKRRYQSLV